MTDKLRFCRDGRIMRGVEVVGEILPCDKIITSSGHVTVGVGYFFRYKNPNGYNSRVYKENKRKAKAAAREALNAR